MDKFMYSDKENGPWFALENHTTPQAALDAARASFQWQAVWIAKMREADAADVFPPSFVDEIAENLVLKHGNALAEEIIQRINSNRQGLMNLMWKAGTHALSGGDGPIWVAEMKHGYNPEQAVRPADFNKELQAEISRKKTAEAIKEQRKRQAEEAKELEEWKEKQENKPKLGDLL